MKKILLTLTAITLLTGAAVTTASALTPSTYATDVKVYLNGENVYEGSDVQPCIMNDRTMVQIRPIFEKLGYKAEFDENTQTAVFYGGIENMSVRFTNESYTVTAISSEGEIERTVDIDVPATIYNGSFYVPLRAFCEIVSGLTIDWNDTERSVYIKSKITSDEETPVVKNKIAEGEYYTYTEDDNPDFFGTLNVSDVNDEQATIDISFRQGRVYEELTPAYLQPDGTYVTEGYRHRENNSRRTEDEHVIITITVNDSNNVTAKIEDRDTSDTYIFTK